MKRARIITCLSILALVAALVYAPILTKGVRQGLELATGMFIPSMLPFYFFANFFCLGKAGRGLETIFAPLCRFLRLPKQAASCILMGFLGGYPAGAITVGELCNKGLLDRKSAARLMLFCTNAGPGFVIGAVGTMMLHSFKAGLLIFGAQLSASVTMAIFSLFLSRRGEMPPESKNATSIGFFSTVSESVAKACLSCLYAAGFISLASGAVSVICGGFKLNGKPEAFISALFEVTRGCFSISNLEISGSVLVIFISAAVGFGGISVLLQLFSFCGKWVSAKVLILARVANAVLTALYTVVFCALFGGPTIAKQAVQTMAAISQGQLPAAFILVTTGFIFCIAKIVEEWYNSCGKTS